MICPCGCKRTLHMNFLADERPCWRVMRHEDGTATLHPSVWRKKDCQSHFWFRRGRIQCARGLPHFVPQQLEIESSTDDFQPIELDVKGQRLRGRAGFQWFNQVDRHRYDLAISQVAESALIRNRAMSQQLCQHA